MKMRKRQSSIFFISIFILLFLNVYYVNAVDELALTGELKSVDAFSGIAIVDVKTEGCQEIERFKVADISELDGLEGKTISFYIDSSTCKGSRVYTMNKVRFRRSGRR
jgi:hypothetical protein